MARSDIAPVSEPQPPVEAIDASDPISLDADDRAQLETPDSIAERVALGDFTRYTNADFPSNDGVADDGGDETDPPAAP